MARLVDPMASGRCQCSRCPWAPAPMTPACPWSCRWRSWSLRVSHVCSSIGVGALGPVTATLLIHFICTATAAPGPFRPHLHTSRCSLGAGSPFGCASAASPTGHPCAPAAAVPAGAERQQQHILTAAPDRCLKPLCACCGVLQCRAPARWCSGRPASCSTQVCTGHMLPGWPAGATQVGSNIGSDQAPVSGTEPWV